MWGLQRNILTSSHSKEVATGLQPAVKVISVVKSWWKLVKKNATLQIYLYSLFGSDDNSREYCTNDTVKNTLLHEMPFSVIITQVV